MRTPREIIDSVVADTILIAHSTFTTEFKKKKAQEKRDIALAQLEEYYKPPSNAVLVPSDKLKEMQKKLKTTPLEPIDEQELDKTLLEAGVAGDTTRRCLVLAIKERFGI